jgi:hypothetical protein
VSFCSSRISDAADPAMVNRITVHKIRTFIIFLPPGSVIQTKFHRNLPLNSLALLSADG